MSQPHGLWDAVPRRYYRREWVRNKPHLPKSASLPIFKLLPLDRPIFTCQRCGFINTLIPLCLWCCWTSDEAHHKFDNSTPRPRRASEPPRFRRKPTAVLKTPDKESHQDLTTIKQTVTPQSVGRIHSIRLSGNVVDNRLFPNADLTLHHLTAYQDPEATASPSLQVANATAPAPTSARAKSLVRSSWSNENTGKVAGTAGATPQPSLHFPRLRHSVSAGVDRRRPMHLIKTFSTKSLRSAPILIDLKALHDLKVKPPINNHHVHDSAPPTRKTLRRKKGISLFRTSAPTPSRPPSSSSSSSFEEASSKTPQLNAATGRNPNLVYKPDTLAHSRSKSQPSNVARLGHPSRPYYTAIRPNMSPRSPSADLPDSYTMAPQATPTPRPPRPMSLPTPSRAPSPGIFSVLSSTSALSEEEEPAILGSEFSFRPRAFSANSQRPVLGPGPHHHCRGFSLSGETELRMALAERGNSSVGDDFKFRDTGKRFNGARVFEKVRGFKKGLRGLVGK